MKFLNFFKKKDSVSTKKLLVEYDLDNPNNESTEFLAIGYKDKNLNLIGLKTGKVFKSGLLVYIGKDITNKDILVKLNKIQTKEIDFVFSDNLLNQYIQAIQDFKIGDKLFLEAKDDNFKFTSMK